MQSAASVWTETYFILVSKNLSPSLFTFMSVFPLPDMTGICLTLTWYVTSNYWMTETMKLWTWIERASSIFTYRTYHASYKMYHSVTSHSSLNISDVWHYQCKSQLGNVKLIISSSQLNIYILNILKYS